MTYDEAIESTITGYEVLAELDDHGVSGYVDGDSAVREEGTDDLIASAVNPSAFATFYRGSEVLAWLGY
ncbi:hypothetical protein ACQU0X_08565 [Pseudovibrio ascidiaceicola]|uniref:hypothetical protein n=1 Tax=Pseudovibrio ascidiaceicola TaxID=285279 RepID=UPI003D367171